MKRILYAYESKSCPLMNVHQDMKAFYASCHHNTTSCDSDMKLIKNLRPVIMNCSGALGDHLFLVNNKLKYTWVEPPNANYQKIKTANTEAKETYIPVAFLSGLNRKKYGKLTNELRKAFIMVHDEYPKTLTSAYDL